MPMQSIGSEEAPSGRKMAMAAAMHRRISPAVVVAAAVNRPSRACRLFSSNLTLLFPR